MATFDGHLPLPATAYRAPSEPSDSPTSVKISTLMPSIIRSSYTRTEETLVVVAD